MSRRKSAGGKWGVAEPVTMDGIRFPSKAEGRRYLLLKLLQRGGQITGLQVHKRFPIDVNGVTVCHYEADFVYKLRCGKVVVEDVKGLVTPVFTLKKKLMLAVYGTAVKVVPCKEVESWES